MKSALIEIKNNSAPQTICVIRTLTIFFGILFSSLIDCEIIFFERKKKGKRVSPKSIHCWSLATRHMLEKGTMKPIKEGKVQKRCLNKRKSNHNNEEEEVVG